MTSFSYQGIDLKLFVVSKSSFLGQRPTLYGVKKKKGPTVDQHGLLFNLAIRADPVVNFCQDQCVLSWLVKVLVS